MTNKTTGEPAGYGFVNFDSDQESVFIDKFIKYLLILYLIMVFQY